jgi:hypothetical protein
MDWVTLGRNNDEAILKQDSEVKEQRNRIPHVTGN